MYTAVKKLLWSTQYGIVKFRLSYTALNPIRMLTFLVPVPDNVAMSAGNDACPGLQPHSTSGIIIELKFPSESSLKEQNKS